MKKGFGKPNRLLLVVGLLLGSVFLFSILVSSPVTAVTPNNQTINFQGRLLNTQGATVPDGSYNLEFKIYENGDGQSAGDTTGSPAGTLLWTEDWLNSASNGVSVKNGYLSVNLGSVNPFGSSINWNDGNLWLSMQVGNTSSCTITTTFQSDCGGDGEMTPMQPLTASPYALNAGLLDGVSSAGFVQLAQGLQTDASNNTSIYINKTGTGNILDLQSAGADAFTVTNSGDLTFGANANHTLSVATAGSGSTGNSLTIASGAAGTGGSALAGGNLVLEGGAGGGTNGNGGNVSIDAGAKNGSGSDGDINIGTNHSAATTIGNGGTSSQVEVQAGGTTQIVSNSGTTIKTTNNATTAFQVQNSGGTNLLNVDTTNNQLTLGTSNSITVGNTSSGTNTYYNYYNGSQQQLLGQEFTTTTGGALSSMSTYVGADGLSSSPNNKYQMGIYTNSSGAPGSYVASTAVGTLSGSAGWDTLPISVTLSPDTTYWFVYWTNVANSNDNSQNYINYYNGPNDWYSSFDNWQCSSGCGASTNGMPNAFPGGSDNYGAEFSIYATYAADQVGELLQSTGDTIQNGTALLQAASNSTSAFQVNDDNNMPILEVDTTDQEVSVGGGPSYGANLTVYDDGQGNGGGESILGNSYDALNIVNGGNAQAFGVSTANNLSVYSADLSVGSLNNVAGTGLLFGDDFESGNFSLWSGGASGNISIDNTMSVSGKSSAKIDTSSSTGYATTKFSTSSNTLSLSGWFNWAALPSSGELPIMTLYQSSNPSNKVQLYIASDWHLGVINGSTDLGEAAGYAQNDSWTWVTMLVNTSTGKISVYVDGDDTQDYTGLTLPGNWDTLQIGPSTSNTGEYWLDDIALDTGTNANEPNNVNVQNSLHVAGSTTLGSDVLIQPASNATNALQVQNASSDSVFSVDTSTGTGQVVLGQAGVNNGTLEFESSDSSGGSVTLQAPSITSSDSYSLILPTSAPSGSGECLQTSSSTQLSFGTCGATGSFIDDQTSQQSGANFNIQDEGQLATLDATGSTLAIGAANTYTGAINIDTSTSVSSGTVTVGGANQTGAITVGNSTASNTVEIGNGASSTGNTQTVKIGDGSDTGTGDAAVTVGNSVNASSLLLQAGTGNLSLTTGTGSGTTGSISITSGNSSAGASGNITIDAGTNVPSGTQIEDKTFETGLDNMVDGYGDSDTLTSSTAEAHSGTHSLAVTVGSNAPDWLVADAEPFPQTVTAGHSYDFAAWVRAGSNSDLITGGANFSTNGYGGGGSVGTYDWGSATDTTGGWTELTGTLVAPTGSNYVGLYFYSEDATSSGEIHYIDDVTITDVSSTNTPAINIGANNAQAITIGNSSQTAATNLLGGDGGININAGDGANVNIGTSMVNTITVGSTSGAGSVILQSDGITQTLSDSGSDIVETQTNTPTALQVQDANGYGVFTVDTSTGTGQVVLGQSGENNGTLEFESSDSSGGSVTLQAPSITTSASYSLTLPTAAPSGSGQCLQTSSSTQLSFGTCGATGSFIFNQTSQQTSANFDIQSVSGQVAAKIQGAASQDILDLYGSASSSTPVISVKSSGALTLQGGLSQDITSTGTNNLSIDTAGAASLNLGTTNATTVAIGNSTGATAVNIASGSGSINLNNNVNNNTNINTGTSTGATSIGSTGYGGNVSISSSSSNTIASTAGATSETLVNAGDTIKTTTNSGTAFQVQNASGYNDFSVSTSAAQTILGNVTSTSGHQIAGVLAFADSAASGDSALLELSAALGGTSTIYQLPVGSNTTQTICTSVAASCSGTYQAAGNYANTTLSNLGTTSINANLIPNANDTLSVGSTSDNWADIYSDNYEFDSTGNGTVGFEATAAAAGKTLNVNGQNAGGTTNGGGAITVQGGTGTTTGAGGLLTLDGGNAASGGTNGGVTIDTGSGATTANGTINVGATNAATINVGNETAATATTIEGGATGGVGIQAGSGGTISIGTVNNNSVSIGTAAAAGAITVGGGSQTGSITIGQSTASNTIYIGNANTAVSAIQTIDIGAGTGVTTGKSVVTIGSSANASSLSLQSGTGDIQIATAGVVRATFDTSNDLFYGNGITASSPNNFTLSGTESSATAVTGGSVTLQGGNATTGSANGGNLTLTGGNGFGSGYDGIVVLTTPTFSTTSNDPNCYTGGGLVSSSCTIAQATVNDSSAVIVGFSVINQTASLPSPSNTTAGKVIYITAASTSSDFTLSVNGGGTGNTIDMRPSTTATMIWSGSEWTAAGASSSTTLQSAYDDTLQSAGGAELVVSHTSNTDGLNIRDSLTNPVDGLVMTVQSSSAALLFSVNDNVTQYASDGGAETYGGTTSTFPSSTWSDFGTHSTVTRYTTVGNDIATGQGSVSVANLADATNGVSNELTSALTANLDYNVSFAARLASGTGTFTTMNVYYSVNGTTQSVACVTGQAVDISVWTKVNCTFQAPSSGITSSNSILIFQSDATARTFYIDNLSVTINASQSYATDGGVDNGTNFTTDWPAVGSDTVTRSTTVGQTNSDSAEVTTSSSGGGPANQGISNLLSIDPLPSTLYQVTVYAASTTSGFNSFNVSYSPNNGSDVIQCDDYNTQDISSSVTDFTEVTCYIQTDSTTVTTPYVYFTQTDTTPRTFYVDTFSMTLASNTTSDVQIGGGVDGGPTTLLTLDSAAGPPIAANDANLLGSMYYDTTLGQLQCYEADGWGSCGAAANTIVTLSPEYTNAVLHGPSGGTAGVGTMTSDFCSSTLNINNGTSGQPDICGSNETFNFYHWTSPQATAQTYAIYVTYQLPETFNTFESGQTSLMGFTDSSNSSVSYKVYNDSPTGGLTECGTSVSVSSGAQTAWQTATATGSADPSTCDFVGGDSILFEIDMTASQNANAYVGNLDFTFSNQ